MSSCPLYAGTPILSARRSIALHVSVTVRRAEATVILIHFRAGFQFIFLPGTFSFIQGHHSCAARTVTIEILYQFVTVPYTVTSVLFQNGYASIAYSAAELFAL